MTFIWKVLFTFHSKVYAEDPTLELWELAHMSEDRFYPHLVAKIEGFFLFWQEAEICNLHKGVIL